MGGVLMQGLLRIAVYYVLGLLVYLVCFKPPDTGLARVPDDPAIAAACQQLRAGMTLPEAEN